MSRLCVHVFTIQAHAHRRKQQSFFNSQTIVKLVIRSNFLSNTIKNIQVKSILKTMERHIKNYKGRANLHLKLLLPISKMKTG